MGSEVNAGDSVPTGELCMCRSEKRAERIPLGRAVKPPARRLYNDCMKDVRGYQKTPYHTQIACVECCIRKALVMLNTLHATASPPAAFCFFRAECVCNFTLFRVRNTIHKNRKKGPFPQVNGQITTYQRRRSKALYRYVHLYLIYMNMAN